MNRADCVVVKIIPNMEKESKVKIMECCYCGCKIPIEPLKVGGSDQYPPSMVCESCEKKKETERKEKAKAHRIENYNENRREAGLPVRYAEIKFSSLEIDEHNREAVDAAKSFIENPKGFLTFIGGAGRGKTWIAAAIAREMILNCDCEWWPGRPPPIKWIRAIDALNSIRAEFSQPGENKARRMLYSARILFLDDLGTEKVSDWVIETIYDLIDFRYCEALPTVITSNLGGQDLAKVFGTRVVSRLMGDGKKIVLGGDDRRLK
jgi:DNA replication protein DnaC